MQISTEKKIYIYISCLPYTRVTKVHKRKKKKKKKTPGPRARIAPERRTLLRLTKPTADPPRSAGEPASPEKTRRNSRHGASRRVQPCSAKPRPRGAAGRRRGAPALQHPPGRGQHRPREPRRAPEPPPPPLGSARPGSARPSPRPRPAPQAAGITVRGAKLALNFPPPLF